MTSMNPRRNMHRGPYNVDTTDPYTPAVPVFEEDSAKISEVSKEKAKRLLKAIDKLRAIRSKRELDGSIVYKIAKKYGLNISMLSRIYKSGEIESTSTDQAIKNAKEAIYNWEKEKKENKIAALEKQSQQRSKEKEEREKNEASPIMKRAYGIIFKIKTIDSLKEIEDPGTREMIKDALDSGIRGDTAIKDVISWLKKWDKNNIKESSYKDRLKSILD